MAALMWSCSRLRLRSRKSFSISACLRKSKANKSCSRYHSTGVTETASNDEYSETPQYPPCFDPSPLNRKRMLRQEWYDLIQTLPTVEEKLVEIGKDGPSYNVFTMSAIPDRYNPLPLTLFNTRTHVVEGMPVQYDDYHVDAVVEYIKPWITKTLRHVFADNFLKYPDDKQDAGDCRKDKMRGRMMIDTVYRLTTSLLSLEQPHLKDCQVDYRPRCESFWWSGGFPPTEREKYRRRKQWHKISEDTPMDFLFQFIDEPYMQIRHRHPLLPFAHRDDHLCTHDGIQQYDSSPQSGGYRRVKRYVTSVPGFWPGDSCGFGTLSFYTREKLLRYVNRFGDDTVQNVLHNCGVLSSFAWLVALAYHKGFSPFHELTYPMATQTVVTNGQMWSFYAYQLNTLCLSADVDTGVKRNVCWATKEMKLFDAVENGEVKGFDDTVLKQLVKLVMNPPVENPDINLTPYLSPVEYSETWAAIRQNLRCNYSNRVIASHIPPPTLWERIYKKKFVAKLE